MQEQIQANIPYAAVSPTDSEGQQSRRNNPRHKNIREAMEMTMHILFLLCGIVAVAFVLLISIYLIISGIPAIREVGLVISCSDSAGRRPIKPIRHTVFFPSS